MQSTRSSLAIGLIRTHTAPELSACSWTRLSGNAVIIMIGILQPNPISFVWSSSPDIPVSLTSIIRHDVLSSRPDCKNSSADENASPANPSAAINPVIASRTPASSSTHTMSGVSDTSVFLGVLRSLMPRRAIAQMRLGRSQIANGCEATILWSRFQRVCARKAELIGHPYELRQRLGLHLTHHVTAMKLYCRLGDTDGHSDLLV